MLKNMINLAINTLICAVFGTLIGCGTKGPLYIPEQRYPQEAEKPTSPDTIQNKEKAPATQSNSKE